MNRQPAPSRFLLKLLLALGLLFTLTACRSGGEYHQIPVPDRRMNLLGLEAVATKYLDEHPQDFHKFARILTAADDTLGKHRTFTHGQVMAWIQRSLKREGYDEAMPVYFFLRKVYLNGWEGAYVSWVDEEEREYLYDLISAVMGGMHRCSTCSTGHMDE